MRMGVGFYIEESLHEVVGRFHAAVQRELLFGEPALRLAAPVLLRDIARAMKSAAPPPEPWQRGVVLVLSQPQGGIKGLIREFALLRRSLWETLSPRHAIPAQERQEVERCLDEALAAAADRWASMVRLMTPGSARAVNAPVAAKHGMGAPGTGARPVGPPAVFPPPLPAGAKKPVG